MYYLKKYVKFRKEKDYILLCDCSSITNYELPLELFDFLTNLKEGVERDKINDELELGLLEDFINLNLVSNNKNSNEGFHNNEWIDLGYEETEFFGGGNYV